MSYSTSKVDRFALTCINDPTVNLGRPLMVPAIPGVSTVDCDAGICVVGLDYTDSAPGFNGPV